MKISITVTILLYFNLSLIWAQNPIIQTNYTADPAPLVYNGKLYLYTSHDEDNSTWFTMNDWRLYTTEDMVNWTDHGTVLEYTQFSWALKNAWAPHAIERNGKFYLYVPLTTRSNETAIGVAVADSPYGPFYDPLGKPLIPGGYGNIDPAAFIDEDGQAYLYWGNPSCKYVKLNEDMISISGEIQDVPMDTETFGKRDGNPDRPTLYEEGPWLYERNDLYYLLFAAGPIPEHLGYSTGKSATGPWTYRGKLMPTEGTSFTNHPGIIDYKGKTYLFYHNGALPGGNGFNRSVCVEEVTFNPDGSIQQLSMTEGIQKPLAPVNPYLINQAETMAWSENMKSFENDVAGVFVTATSDGAYSMVKQVDFGRTSPKQFSARVGTTHSSYNSKIILEVRLDSHDGALLTSIDVPLTGGNDRWELVKNELQLPVTGVHDLYFIARGNVPRDLFYFDFWGFTK